MAEPTGAQLRAEVVAGLGHVLNGVRRVPEAAELILSAADQLFGWDACRFFLYSREADLIEPVLEIRLAQGRRSRVTSQGVPFRPVGRVRKAIREGAQLVLQPRHKARGQSCAEIAQPLSLLMAPIRHGSDVLGLVSIQSFRKNAYNSETLALMQALADYCGAALNRIRSETRLRQSEERFRLLAEAINEVFWIQDTASGCNLYVSPAYEKVWARKALNCYGQPRCWIDSIHPADLDAFLAAESNCGPGETRDHEYRIVRPNGEVRWIHDRAFPVFDKAAGWHRLVGVAEDITDRRAAQDRVRFQASLLDQVHNAVIATDLEGRVIYWNKYAETLYQWTGEEIRGRDLRPLMVPPQQAGVGSTIWAEIEKRGYWQGVFEVFRKDGTAIPVQVVNTLVRDGCGRPAGVVGVSSDLTERRRAEQVLRQSEQRFTAFIENLPGFAWIKDSAGRYLYLSPDRGERSDHPVDWQGKTSEELWPSELSEEYKRNDQKVLATGRPVQTIERYYRAGKPAYALVSKFPILDNKGKVLMVGGIAVDITDRKKAEEALRRSEAQLHELAMRLQGAREEESLRIAREIHDVLGQSLTSLNLELMAMRQEVGASSDRLLKSSLRRKIKSMQGLLKGTISSVQRISNELRPDLLDDLGLSAALEWQAEQFQRRTRIRCRWKRPPTTVDLSSTEATALFRIFQEALTNVARHARARLVTLELEREGKFLVMEIADNGKGFKESAAKGQASLGLLGMRERAGLIGAGFLIRSAPGKGTTVTVALALD